MLPVGAIVPIGARRADEISGCIIINVLQSSEIKSTEIRRPVKSTKTLINAELNLERPVRGIHSTCELLAAHCIWYKKNTVLIKKLTNATQKPFQALFLTAALEGTH